MRAKHKAKRFKLEDSIETSRGPWPLAPVSIDALLLTCLEKGKEKEH